MPADIVVDCETARAVPFNTLRAPGGRMAEPGPRWAEVDVASISWCSVCPDGVVSGGVTRFVSPAPGVVVDNPYSPEVTPERLLVDGEPGRDVFSSFADAVLRHDRIVSHNADFDRGAILSHMMRLGLDDAAAAVAGKEWMCTMMRGAEGGRIKYPKLASLAKDLGVAWDGPPHTSMADAIACARCHAAMMALGR